MANVNALGGLMTFPFADGVVARIVDHDGPLLYAAGGETITARALGFKSLMLCIAAAAASGSFLTQAYIPNKKLGATVKIVWSTRTTGAESGAVDLSAQSCKLFVVGIPA